MLKDLVHRILTSCFLVTILVVLLVFADALWGRCLITFMAAALAAVAIWEYQQFATVKGGRMVFPVVALAAILQVVSFFLSGFSSSLILFPVVSFLFGLIGLTILHFEEKEGAIVDLATSIFGLVYIAVPLGMMVWILCPTGDSTGRFWFLYLIAVTKMGDIGGYFGGTFFGKRKLAPTISPGKTIEGSVFGLLSALTTSFLFYQWGLHSSENLLGPYAWIFLGLTLGIIGQFGDLAESLLKRDANKKDSSSLPGLGGVLDLVDSLLFNSPILFLYVKTMYYS
jgi:phosphatidate cytidylyltransferase